MNISRKYGEEGFNPGFAGVYRTACNRKYLVAGVVAVLTFAVYLPALQNDFVWDDVQYIIRNSFIRSINGNLFKSAFLAFQADNWHPLTWISHAIDYSLWGLNPVGHHLTNIVLHAVNTFIVVLLVARLMELGNPPSSVRVTPPPPAPPLSASRQIRRGEEIRGGRGSYELTGDVGGLSSRWVLIASGVTGLLFGLHPLHVESVAWISERKDLLCALFFLLSIMSYVKYVRRGGPIWPPTEGQPQGVAPTRKDPRPGESPEETGQAGMTKPGLQFLNKHYLLALCLFALALMSKPMAVTLPVVLLILDWFPLRRIESQKAFWAAFVEKLPFFALTLISSFLTVLAQKAGGAMEMMQPVPLSTRMFVAARALIVYLQKMIAPINLVPYYPYPEGVSLLSFEYLFPAVLAIGITLFCAAIAKRQKLLLSAWGYFVVTLLPVLGIVQVGNQAMADRYTYLPSLGPFFIIGLTVAVLFEKVRALRQSGLFVKTVGSVAAVVLLTSMSYATIRQIGVWGNNVVFWSYVIEKSPPAAAQSPKSAMPHNNLGLAFASQGQWDRATAEFQKALRLKPDYVQPHYNLGVAYASQGQLDRAIAEYQTALRLKPDSAGAHNNLGIAYAAQGQLDRAIAEFQITARLKPGDAEPHMNLGLAYASQGQLDSAIAELHAALRIKPNDAKLHYNLGNSYASQGRWDQAISEYQTALRLKPDFHEARRSLNEIVSRRQ